jgi:hypothetical protein
VSGTVATVEVAVGDSVTAGQALATMDPAHLQDKVDSAQADLAKAQQQLATDVAAQTDDSSDGSGATSASSDSSGTSGDATGSASSDDSSSETAASGSGSSPSIGSTGGTSAGSGSTSGSGSSGTSGGSAGSGSSTGASSSADDQALVDAVSQAQQAVIGQQKTLDALLATSTQALADEQAICAPVLPATSSSATTPSTTDASSTAAMTTDATTAAGLRGAFAALTEPADETTSSSDPSTPVTETQTRTETTTASETAAPTTVTVPSTVTVTETAGDMSAQVQACQDALQTVSTAQNEVATAQSRSRSNWSR